MLAGSRGSVRNGDKHGALSPPASLHLASLAVPTGIGGRLLGRALVVVGREKSLIGGCRQGLVEQERPHNGQEPLRLVLVDIVPCPRQGDELVVRMRPHVGASRRPVEVVAAP